jgi:CheY-like chemotaxis protein
MDGIEATTRIRKKESKRQKKGKSCTIILMSADSSGSTKDQAGNSVSLLPFSL